MLAKRYVEEEGSRAVDLMFREAEDGKASLCYSIWNVGELAVVFDKYSRGGIVEAKETLRKFLGESKRLGKMRVMELVPLNSSLISSSVKYILKHHIYVADALQIASCVASFCTHFVTADTKLNRVAMEEGLQTIPVALRTT